MTNSVAFQAARLHADTGAKDRKVVSCRGNAFVTRVRLVNGVVDEAWSTGRMTRNMEVLLKGRLDAQGRPDFAHQAHCLCNDGHALAAIRAVEDLAGISAPQSAVLVRRLVQSLRCIQEHLLHVYQFHLADWVSLDQALRADPVQASAMAESPGEDAAHFRSVQERWRVLAETRGTPPPESSYRGPAELHLLLCGHALASLRACSSLQNALGLLGCGPKGFKAYHIGGLSEDFDLSADMLGRLRAVLAVCRDFICTVFSADLARLAQAYALCGGQETKGAFLTGDDVTGCCIIRPADSADGWHMAGSNDAAVQEEREPDWDDGDRAYYRLQGSNGDPRFHWGEGGYFWLPAPRNQGAACEVGPLARVLSGWLSGDGDIRRELASMLDGAGLTLGAMHSGAGRLLSRGIESAALMRAAFGWLDTLDRLPPAENVRAVDFRLPESGIGVGRVEVPRGALTHTITWGDGRILQHDYLIPSLWNFSPRDSSGVRGPLERALMGTPVANTDHPVELLRTLHELDPCNECHVVIEDRDAGRTILATA